MFLPGVRIWIPLDCIKWLCLTGLDTKKNCYSLDLGCKLLAPTFLAWAGAFLHFSLLPPKIFLFHWTLPPPPFSFSSSVITHFPIYSALFPVLLPDLLLDLLPSLLSTLLPDLLPDRHPGLVSTLNSDLLSTNDLLILILPVCCIFSRDAVLVLVDVLLSLQDELLGLLGGPTGCGVIFLASLNAVFMVFTIEDHVFINVLGTEDTFWRVTILSVLSPGEGSKFSTVLVNLPDFLFPEPDEPVVDTVGSPVILSSGLLFGIKS